MIPKTFKTGIMQTPNREFKICPLQDNSFSFLLSMDISGYSRYSRIFLLCSGASDSFKEEDLRV